MSKSVVVVFARELVEGSWNWGEKSFPKIIKVTTQVLILLLMVHGTST